MSISRQICAVKSRDVTALCSQKLLVAIHVTSRTREVPVFPAELYKQDPWLYSKAMTLNLCDASLLSLFI